MRINRSGSSLSRIALFLIFSLLLIGCSDGDLPDLPNVELPSINTAREAPDVVSDSAVKFQIEEAGVYQLTLDEVRKAGLEIDAFSAETVNPTADRSAMCACSPSSPYTTSGSIPHIPLSNVK